MDDLELKKKEAEELKEKITKNPADFAQGNIRRSLYIKQPKVVWTPLGHANVVCESPQCAKIVNDEIVYPQICCRKCTRPWWLGVYWCDKMTWSAQCKVCHCGLNTHKRMTVETKIEEEEVYQPDEEVIAKIVDSDTAVREIDLAISVCGDQMTTCRDETEQMLRTCAKLNSFVHQNVLMANLSDDELSEKMTNRIQTYENAGVKSASSLVYLKEIQCRYNQFLAAEKKTKNHYDVHKLVQQLYRLPTNGNNLKEAMEAEEEARQMVIEEGKKTNVVIRFGSRWCERVTSTGRGIAKRCRHSFKRPK